MDKKIRGFEVVEDKFRKFPNEEIVLPVSKTSGSAGYDFSINEDFLLAPNEKKVFWTDVKSYMLEDEVLEIYVRSSLAIKHNIQLKNQVGIIDSDYYNNENNDGNIGVCLENTSDSNFMFKKGDCVAQGIFKKYLKSDNGNLDEKRKGGIGHTTKK